VGGPGAGKSTFYINYLARHEKYKRINLYAIKKHLEETDQDLDPMDRA
jgi:predicted ABC-type ATPase